MKLGKQLWIYYVFAVSGRHPFPATSPIWNRPPAGQGTRVRPAGARRP
jgi:hypothetical protein